MINMSPGEQEAGNGHAVLEPQLGVSDDTEKTCTQTWLQKKKMNLLSHAAKLQCVIKRVWHSEQVELCGTAPVTVM